MTVDKSVNLTKIASKSLVCYQFMCNLRNSPQMVALPTELFTEAFPGDVKEADFDTVEYQANKCYDNVVQTLLKKMSNRDLRLCIGLNQLIERPEQIVEHCWFEIDGQHFDFLSEMKESRYFKFASYTIFDLLDVMARIGTNTPPNITQLLPCEVQS